MRVEVRHLTHLLVAHLVFSLLDGCTCEANVLLQTLAGSVPAGNYSYYKLARGGNIRLVLRTLRGDADVYVSSATLHPTFEDYDLKSTTYGEETVDIGEALSRPVGIGVYGHPLHQEDTTYEFDILLDTSEIEDPWRVESGTDGKLSPGKLFAGEDAENESLLWKVFIGILKVAVDIMI